ncbi:hypothetical protein HY798_03870 [Candidatus Falkowbacteria bacterium]|nr:hypothetical protein [Candidatus Falkowbacteria bacterium]
MTEESNSNPTPPAADTAANPAPIETPLEAPATPLPTEPSAFAENSAVTDVVANKSADKELPPTIPMSEPVEPTPSPVSPAPVTTPPTSPSPDPAPSFFASQGGAATDKEAGNLIQRLLVKAKEKIQFRKQAKLEKIMVFAKARGDITNDQAQKLLRVSDATASRYLAQLVKSGRLRATGRASATRYTPI